MKKVLFLSLILFFTACTKSSEDGESRQAKDPTVGFCGEHFRVTNGSTCGNLNQTSIALLQLDMFGIPSSVCTGTLITPRTIITAAHCLDIRGGITGLVAGFPLQGGKNNGKFDVYEVERFKANPRWDSNPGNPYDIGIVILKEAVNSRESVPLVSIDGHRADSGDQIGIYGYGKNEDGEIGVLRYGQMELAAVDLGTGYDQALLTAAFDTTGQTICSGDSGGPAGIYAGDSYGIVGINSIGTSEQCSNGDLAGFANLQLDENLNFLLQEKEGEVGVITGDGIQYY